MNNILITGATGGIGSAIVAEMKNVGNVYATSRSIEKLKNLNVKDFFVCDLNNEEELIALGKFTREKKINILINNAGDYVYSDLEKVEISDLNRLLNINLKAPIYLCKCTVPTMKEYKFGRIINIGSISGVMGESGACIYSATKAGLIGMAKSTGLELAQYGITVNTINPGWVDTELGNNSIDESDFTKEEILDFIPQKRFVSPVEIAKLVKFLSSADAKGITGQSINICAGLSVGI